MQFGSKDINLMQNKMKKIFEMFNAIETFLLILHLVCASLGIIIWHHMRRRINKDENVERTLFMPYTFEYRQFYPKDRKLVIIFYVAFIGNFICLIAVGLLNNYFYKQLFYKVNSMK
ncbi:MAG: hypothetical protein P1P64_00415 [Treponemataceae bacterium]